MMQIGSQHRSLPFKIKAMEALQQRPDRQDLHGQGAVLQAARSIGHKPDSPRPPGVNWDLFLGPAPMRPFNELRFGYNWHWFWDTGNGDIGNQGVHEMGVARWGLGDPEWPKTAYAHGGKYAYDDDQETPNTLLASFNYGGREIVFEVRGLMTGARRLPVQRARPRSAGARARRRRPRPRRSDDARLPQSGRPLNVMVGNLFYGTEGWAAISDQGFQAYKGESNELVMEERPERGRRRRRHRPAHAEFPRACRSRATSKDLHDEIGNAYLSAGLCHLANISYRIGRKLTLAAGPKFVGDSEANKMLDARLSQAVSGLTERDRTPGFEDVLAPELNGPVVENFRAMARFRIDRQ